MKLYLKTKNVLDEREMQEMYRIEHRGTVGNVYAAVRRGRGVRCSLARVLRRSRARRSSSPWSASA